MGRMPIDAMIKVERGTEVPDEELTTTSLIRRRLLQGGIVQAKNFAAEHGTSPGFPAQIVVHMRRLGFDIEVDTDDDGLVTYRCTNPEHDPSEDDLTRLRSAASYSRPTGSRAAVKAQPSPPPQVRDEAGRVDGIPPLPDLGQPVVVYALALNDDESITLGLRNGTKRWVATLTGVTEA